MDELLEEILLRLSPDKPACLVRAALVCKRWCRAVMHLGLGSHEGGHGEHVLR